VKPAVAIQQAFFCFYASGFKAVLGKNIKKLSKWLKFKGVILIKTYFC
jgi:hypothetical protein